MADKYTINNCKIEILQNVRDIDEDECVYDALYGDETIWKKDVYDTPMEAKQALAVNISNRIETLKNEISSLKNKLISVCKNIQDINLLERRIESVKVLSERSSNYDYNKDLEEMNKEIEEKNKIISFK